MTIEEKARKLAEENGYGLGCTVPQMECYVNGYLASAKELEQENNRLKRQIKKMKCCYNCRHEWSVDKIGCLGCKNYSNWEMAK